MEGPANARLQWRPMTPPLPFEIYPLAEHPDAIPTLAGWFIDEWTPWYGPDGDGDAHADLHECCQTNALPIALIAHHATLGVLATAALKAQSLGTELATGPWLSAVLTGPEFRGHGIATALISAIETEARRMGFDAVYTTTDAASGIVKRLGWVATGDVVESLRGDVGVWRKRI